MKKIIALILSLLTVAALLCSCGASTPAEVLPVNKNVAGRDGFYSAADEAIALEAEKKKNSEPIAEAPANTETEISRKIVKTFRVSIESLQYDETLTTIKQKVAEFGGYISDSTESGNINSSRHANFTVRVPAEKAEAFLATVGETGNVLSSSLSTDDITDSYYDVKSQLESLEKEEARLLELMEKADTLDYMLKIEDTLTNVRARITSLYYQIQLMDKSVDYSYVYLNVSEVKEYQPSEEPTFWNKIGDALSGAIDVFGSVVQFILLVLAWIWPFLLLAGVILVLIFVIEKKKAKKKSEKNDSEQ